MASNSCCRAASMPPRSRSAPANLPAPPCTPPQTCPRGRLAPHRRQSDCTPPASSFNSGRAGARAAPREYWCTCEVTMAWLGGKCWRDASTTSTHTNQPAPSPPGSWRRRVRRVAIGALSPCLAVALTPGARRRRPSAGPPRRSRTVTQSPRPSPRGSTSPSSPCRSTTPVTVTCSAPSYCSMKCIHEPRVPLDKWCPEAFSRDVVGGDGPGGAASGAGHLGARGGGFGRSNAGCPAGGGLGTTGCGGPRDVVKASLGRRGRRSRCRGQAARRGACARGSNRCCVCAWMPKSVGVGRFGAVRVRTPTDSVPCLAAARARSVA